MEHPAFAEAGGKQGLEIWTIDKFEPVAIPTTDYGRFFNGDAYIVLKTTGDEVLSYDVHFWLGAESSQDKRGAAAILTVVLDDALGGRAVHSREVQQHESADFLGYFKPAIRYLEGGLESGFNQVTTNAGAERRLLKLTGCDNMRISEVPADISSLTRTNCFILEVDHDIFVLLSSEAKATQRRKIISIANKLRDEEHNGRATIEIIDEFSPPEDITAFFEALGSGSQDEMADGSGEDQSYTREGNAVYLFLVIGSVEDMELTTLRKPFKQSHLTSENIYILDTPSSGIYLWIGADVDSNNKKEYSSYAQKYLELKGYPEWVHVSKVSQGAENSGFKQYFTTWEISASAAKIYMSLADEGYSSGDAEEVAASARQIAKTGAARGFMPDNADGSFVVYRIEDSEPVEFYTSESEWQAGGVRVGAFFTCDAYVIKYVYQDEGAESCILYYWVGAEADADEKKAAAKIAADMNEEMGGEATVVKVPQGKEPKHFLGIFKGNLLILLGGKSSEYKGSNKRGSYDEDGLRLFKIIGTEVGKDMRALQVDEVSSSLEDDSVFVLETSAAYYVWNGKEATTDEKQAAVDFLQSLASEDKDVQTVEQGSEPADFWDALGGEGEAEGEERPDNSGWVNALSRRVNVQASLVDVTVTIKGEIGFEKVPAYTQEDLSDDSLYILDVGEEVYLWQGAGVPERVKAAKEAVVEAYLSKDSLERESTVVVGVRQGKEPSVFRRLFPAWDADMWPNQASYEDLKAETKAANNK